MKDSYVTLSSGYEKELKINKSVFIANAFPVSTAEDCTDKLGIIRKKYHDASHHPFAYRLADSVSFRYNDDGEPSGSSGKSVLDAIDKHELLGVFVVVTRYFGGIKLGVGGLKRAYFGSADECLSQAPKKEVVLADDLGLIFDFSYLGAVMRYIEKMKIKVAENSSSDKARLKCLVRIGLTEDFKKDILEITNGSAEIK